ncbi:MAG: right-handed parallel beta-helix repeat-containing protein, partial [Candidatus Hydrogenedens sp.]
MVTRREMLKNISMAGGVLFLPLCEIARAEDIPYISGDELSGNYEKKQCHVTVGPCDSEADFRGSMQKVIQSAIDYIARYGGGTIQILPGVYRFSNAIYLSSHTKIIGNGPSSIFVKEPSVETEFIKDADWYEQSISVAHPERFKIGDGLCIRTKNPHHGGVVVIKRTIISIDGNRLILDKALRENVWLGQETTIATLFPLISGEFVENITIKNLVLDGNKENNLNLDGNYAGCIWLQDCKKVSIRNVEARNYNGDGISWQIVHDVVVDNCYSHDNTGLGLHPGSGSQRPKMINNQIENNDIGIFFCGGVQNGVAEGNQIQNNRVGISIGHRDNNNWIHKNIITDSRECGILFREEQERFTAIGNKIEENVIRNIKLNNGTGISILGLTKGNE